MLVLNATDVRQALPMPLAIEAAKGAFAALSDGRAVVPLRGHLPVQPHGGITLVMPAFVTGTSESLAVKVVSVFPGNPAKGIPTSQAAVIVLEPETGRPIALIEGSTLTAIRTAAASGAATDLLARTDSKVVAIFGAGVQARTQLEAVCTVRSIATGWIYDTDADRVNNMIEELAGVGPIPADLRCAASSTQAVSEADIVCTATTSPTPVFADADLRNGVHINAVGAYTPHAREIPEGTVVRARVVVDSRDAAWAEAGDLIQPRSAGLIAEDHVHADLGELVLGRADGRTAADQITFFKSVGVAVQDAVAAAVALQRATQLALGQQVTW